MIKVGREKNLKDNEYHGVPCLSYTPGYQNILTIWGKYSKL